MTSSSRSIRAGLGIAPVTLVQALAERAWAQAADGPARGDAPARLEGSVTLILILAAGLLILLGLVAKVLDLRLKRDGEVIAVKGVVSDALGGDPELFELPLTTTVRVPLWTGSPVTIRVFGEVPTRDLKRLVLRRVERAATTELAVRARVKSRIGVAPGASDPPLRRARSG
ncbi:MAG: hypothetical protein ACRELZ_11115 [Candidatus Rokuibacteriota bacterium]